VLVIDDEQVFVSQLSQPLREGGHTVWIAATFREALSALEFCKPKLVISELRIAGVSLFDFLPDLSKMIPPACVAVATVYPSVATAVKVTRMGLAAYFTKPVSASAVLSILESPSFDPLTESEATYQWPTLDRTIWEYLNQVYVVAGSISEAARRLGVDRRSLRRMLSKYPPAR
jgi:two-component system response regulator RegA